MIEIKFQLYALIVAVHKLHIYVINRKPDAKCTIVDISRPTSDRAASLSTY